MNEPPKKRWGILQWGVVLVVVLLTVSWLLALTSRTQINTHQMHGVSNCKQVVLALKLFARDNGSAYPDSGPEAVGAESANQVFRRLFEEGIVTDEHIFGCPNSVFVPDGKIGDRRDFVGDVPDVNMPDFSKALEPGECHWMLMKGQSDASGGNLPLVLENALNASWPQKWDVSRQAGSKKGRAWPGGCVIMGHNDGSVSMERVNSDGMINWGAWDKPGQKSWVNGFPPGSLSQLSYWDVEEK